MGGVPGLLVLCRVVTKGGAPVTALGWEELALTSGRSLWLGPGPPGPWHWGWYCGGVGEDGDTCGGASP